MVWWSFSLVFCIVLMHFLFQNLSVHSANFVEGFKARGKMKPYYHDVLYGYKVAFSTDGTFYSPPPQQAQMVPFMPMPPVAAPVAVPVAAPVAIPVAAPVAPAPEKPKKPEPAPDTGAGKPGAGPRPKSKKVTNPLPVADVPPVKEHLPEGKSMVLRWSDEFTPDPSLKNGGIDEDLWRFHLGDGSDFNIPKWANDEMQCYTDKPDNIAVVPMEDNPDKGKLVITALANDGPCKSAKGAASTTQKFTSAKIVCREPVHWVGEPGASNPVVITAKLKVPVAAGSWPAFWLLPATDEEWCSGCGKYGGWVSSGEIDIMEHVNTETKTNSALHSGGKPDVLWEGDNRKEGKLDLGGDISDWHEHTLIWDSTSIKTYVDGKLVLDTKLGDWSSIRAPDNKYAPFDQPFVVILNLAIGGKWPTPDGKAPPADGFPYKYEIQYVRVYDVV